MGAVVERTRLLAGDKRYDCSGADDAAAGRPEFPTHTVTVGLAESYVPYRLTADTVDSESTEHHRSTHWSIGLAGLGGPASDILPRSLRLVLARPCQWPARDSSPGPGHEVRVVRNVHTT